MVAHRPSVSPNAAARSPPFSSPVGRPPDHIGVGRTHTRTRVLILVHDLNIRIIKATTGGLLRYLILDPTCHYQPTGNPKGPVPAKTVSMRQRNPQIALTRTWGRNTAAKRIAEIGENEGRSWPRRQSRG